MRINSLLNTAEGRTEYRPQTPPSASSSQEESPRFGNTPSPLIRQLERQQPLATGYQGPPTCATSENGPVHNNRLNNSGEYSNSISNSSHVIRAQPVYTLYDCRYLPYLPHAYTANPSPNTYSENPTASAISVPAAAGASTAGVSSFPLHPAQQLPHSSAFRPLHVSPHHTDPYADYFGDCVPWQRQRRTRACQNCHTKKIKCNGDGKKCYNCVRTNVECKWVPMKKRGPKPKTKLTDEGTLSALPTQNHLVSALATPQGQAIPPISLCWAPAMFRNKESDPNFLEISDEIMRRFYSDEVSEDTREAVVYYFDYFYGICPIFHPATFIRRVVNGEVDELLIDAMRASAARIISKHTGKFIDVDFIISSVQGRLLLGLDNPTLDYVSAVVVIASLCGGECKFVSYNSLSCLSGSLVTRLGWHTIDLYSTSAEGMSWEDWVTLELKRRIFWVVYEIDSYQSLLSDRPMTISETRLFVSAPGADFTWEDVTIPQAKHWPTRFDHKMSKEDILRTGSVLHTFIESCNLTALISRINNFLWDVKIGVLSKTPADRHAPNIRYLRLNPLNDLQTSGSVSSMFEYPEFCELHRLTMEWKNDLIRPEEMKGTWVANQHFSQFGSLRHRLFIMRTRYFNLYCYSVPILLSLHMANRPSFFSKNTPVNTELGSVEPATPKSVEESIEDKTIREMLATAFADRMNDGLLAYDIVEESWKICMDIVYDFVAFFDQNSDIPLDRCDQVMPFSLFTSITVFIRQIKKCRQKINGADDTTSTHDLQGYRGELSRSVSALRRLWAKLKDLGFIWRIEGMEHLLRTMQIEEVANAADLFSGLAL